MFALEGDVEYAARCEALDPSTTPEEVRCEGGANQRTLGFPSACTYFAVAFVRRLAGARVGSADIGPAWVARLLAEPGIAVPRSAVHPDPCAVAAAPGTGLCVLRGDCAARARDAVFVPLAALEARLLDAINATGIGPQGFSGDTTALSVAVAAAPTHIAGLPVAVNINCHVLRHAEITL